MKLEGKCRSCYWRASIRRADVPSKLWLMPCDHCIHSPFQADLYDYDETEADDHE